MVVTRLLGVLLLTALASFSGCSPEGGETGSRADRVVAEFGLKELSDFESKVLDDGLVAQAEYDEAYQRWLDCAKGVGLGVEPKKDEVTGAFHVVNISVPADENSQERQERDAELSISCEDGNFTLIDAVYRDQVMNPDAKDWDEGVVACMVEDGVVGPDFDKEQYLSEEPLPDAAWASDCLWNPFGIQFER